MKKLFSFAAAVAFIALAASCSNNNSYTISGSIDIPEFEGHQVYKYNGGIFSPDRTIDSTVVKEGKYSFTGSVEEPDYCTILVRHEDNEQSVYRTVILENAKISISTDADKNTVVSGTALNDAYQAFEEKDDAVFAKLMQARKTLAKAKEDGTLTPELEKSLNDEMDAAYGERDKLSFNYVKENINNPGGWSMLHNTAMSTDLEGQKELIANADEKTKQLPDYAQIVERINILESTAVGKKFTDFKMQDPDGNDISISDIAGKGKYVLIDFWASWCGPCREEMPNVIKAYNQYKDKGFDIIGVSLDGKRESWVKAIKELGLPWHHMSDLKSWECEGSALYGVTGIPHTVLLDKEGIIIARGIRGEELINKLGELL